MAELAQTQRFDLTKPAHRLFRSKRLHELHHVMQGFAFDNQNARLFIAQARDGGSGDDLCITQLTFSGEVAGFVHLNDAGHGVSIGVEPVGASSFLWVECDSDAAGPGGRGTALARFEFVSGRRPELTRHLPDSKTITCATDPVYERLAVRRELRGKMHFSLHELARAARGDFSAPLADFDQPALSDHPVTFQGYTILGSYLYTLDGNGHADPSDIDSYLTCIDMRNGRIVSRVLTRAGASLAYREPEGMSVYRTKSGELRLFLGFGSRHGTARRANLYYENVLRD